MRKSRYVTLLMMGAAASLAACDQHDMTKDGTIYGDVETCSKERDASECTQAFEQAKTAHEREAPKFKTKEECEAAGYSACEVVPVGAAGAPGTTIINNNSGGGGFFMPMMMGYMMSRAFGGGGYGYGGGYGASPNQAPPQAPGSTPSGTPGGTAGGAAGRGYSRPVYSDRSGYLYTDGKQVARVALGTTSLARTSLPPNSVARGGFGGGARSFSAGS